MKPRHSGSITALDLLHLYLDLRGLTPDLDDWTEEALASNPPRLTRLRQLVALFRAFDIPWGPSDFELGAFLRNRSSLPEALIATAASEIGQEETKPVMASPGMLRITFQSLLRYRVAVQTVLNHNQGVYEANGFAYFALLRMDALNRTIDANISGVDEVLSGLIDPAGRVYRPDDLFRDFGYPIVDIDETDSGWW